MPTLLMTVFIGFRLLTPFWLLYSCQYSSVLFLFVIYERILQCMFTPSRTHSPYSLTHSLTLLTYSLTHSLTHSPYLPTHSLTHSLTYSPYSLTLLTHSLTRYNDQQSKEEQQEETGWKQCHGDVFRPPTFAPILFSCFVGTGVQLGFMAVATLTFAILGLLSPANRGSLTTALIMLFVFMGTHSPYLTHSLTLLTHSLTHLLTHSPYLLTHLKVHSLVTIPL